MSTLIIAVLAFTSAIVLLQTAKSYIEYAGRTRRTGLRLLVLHDILKKSLVTDYANLEDKDFTDAKQKAHHMTGGNNCSPEQIYYTFEKLGANLLGFIFYIFLLVQVNPLILLLTAGTTVLGYFTRRWANKWRHDNDNEETGYIKRT